MKTHKTNVYLVRILIPIAYMPPEKYIQEATFGPKGRVYIHKGAAGGKSIGAKSVKILACGVMFLEH